MTQSIKKLEAGYREAALDRKGFLRLSDGRLVDLDQLDGDDYDGLFYKEEFYSIKKLENRLIITYSPKYAANQKEIRARQVERVLHMLKDGNHKNSQNPQ